MQYIIIGGSDSKGILLQCGRPGFVPWIGKIPWKRAWQRTPVFLPGESSWTEEAGGLQSMASQRGGHDWAAKHSTAQLYVIIIIRYYYGEGDGSPLQYSCLENPMDGGTW